MGPRKHINKNVGSVVVVSRIVRVKEKEHEPRNLGITK